MYETFSILTGVLALIAAIALPMSGRHRFMSLAASVFYTGYGVYVAQAKSGYFTLPAIIFVAPFGLAFLIGRELLGKTAGHGQPTAVGALSPRPPAQRGRHCVVLGCCPFARDARLGRA